MEPEKKNDTINKTKEDDTMSVYVKPIQTTPSLTGADAVNILRKALQVPSESAIEKKQKNVRNTQKERK